MNRNHTFGLGIIATTIIIVGFYPLILDQIDSVTYVQKYFFFQDPDFLMGYGSLSVRWKGFSWNKSSPFNYSIDLSNGSATLFYNVSSGDGWGGAVLLQGKQPHSMEKGWKILSGSSLSDVKETEYVEFRKSKPIEENKFFLEAKVMVSQRNYTVFDGNSEAFSNVGVDLMFGFDDANYDDANPSERVAIHAGIIFSRVSWDNETKNLQHSDNWTGITSSLYDSDFQLTLIRGKITQLNKWCTFKLDMAEILDTIFDLTKKERIYFYGIQVYTDGISSHTEAIFDYVKTFLESS